MTTIALSEQLEPHASISAAQQKYTKIDEVITGLEALYSTLLSANVLTNKHILSFDKIAPGVLLEQLIGPDLYSRENRNIALEEVTTGMKFLIGAAIAAVIALGIKIVSWIVNKVSAFWGSGNGSGKSSVTPAQVATAKEASAPLQQGYKDIHDAIGESLAKFPFNLTASEESVSNESQDQREIAAAEFVLKINDFVSQFNLPVPKLDSPIGYTPFTMKAVRASQVKFCDQFYDQHGFVFQEKLIDGGAYALVANVCMKDMHAVYQELKTAVDNINDLKVIDSELEIDIPDFEHALPKTNSVIQQINRDIVRGGHLNVPVSEGLEGTVRWWREIISTAKKTKYHVAGFTSIHDVDMYVYRSGSVPQAVYGEFPLSGNDMSSLKAAYEKAQKHIDNLSKSLEGHHSHSEIAKYRREFSKISTVIRICQDVLTFMVTHASLSRAMYFSIMSSYYRGLNHHYKFVHDLAAKALSAMPVATDDPFYPTKSTLERSVARMKTSLDTVHEASAPFMKH
jgi:hypothetical protein